jgi:hypothetical protein
MTEKLPFIKWMFTNFPEVVKNIENFSLQKIEYKINSCSTKLGYVLEHLQSLEDGSLDSKDLPGSNEYKLTRLVPNYINLLTNSFLIPYNRIAS